MKWKYKNPRRKDKIINDSARFMWNQPNKMLTHVSWKITLPLVHCPQKSKPVTYDDD